MDHSNDDAKIKKLAEECEAARLAVGEVISANRIDPDMDRINAAIARWREAKRVLRETMQAADRRTES